jgi:hypothetical protein
LEACILGRVGIGNDLSPEAFILTHSKVKAPSLEKVNKYIKQVSGKLDLSGTNIESVDEDVKVFFHPKTLKQIIAWKECLSDELSNESIFVKALFCGILHGRSSISLSLPCSHSFSMSPRYVKRYVQKHNLKKPVRNVTYCLEKKAASVLADDLPKVIGEAYQTNATNLPIEEESIDLILTSPPYFNKQTYAWDNWLRLWFLGYDYKDVRESLFQTGSKQKFIDFMLVCLKEMYRVLRDNSTCFIVLGDVQLNGEWVNTAELVAELAESVGFRVKRIIDDPIPKNKKYFMFLSSKKGIKMDRIIELLKLKGTRGLR